MEKKKTELVYELMIDMMRQMKVFELRKMHSNQEKVISC